MVIQSSWSVFTIFMVLGLVVMVFQVSKLIFFLVFHDSRLVFMVLGYLISKLSAGGAK